MNPPPFRRRPAPETESPRAGLAAIAGEHRAGLAAVLVLAVAIGAGWALWSRFADATRIHPDVVLLPDAVRLRGVADWVKGDVKTEALRGASLDQGLPLDDPELQRRLARAFDMHPWVRRVVAVELLHPAAAVVEIECREPVAMVAWQDGLLAVDAEGFVLPSADFTAADAARYPRVTGVASSPQGVEGAPWGDAAVAEAAAVAAALGPDWEALRLVELRPVRERDARLWELVGGEGQRILFGAAPGREAAGEPPAAAKIARLKAAGAGGMAGRLDLTVEPPQAPPAIPHEPTGRP
jgi:hypothetical protein